MAGSFDQAAEEDGIFSHHLCEGTTKSTTYACSLPFSHHVTLCRMISLLSTPTQYPHRTQMGTGTTCNYMQYAADRLYPRPGGTIEAVQISTFGRLNCREPRISPKKQLANFVRALHD